MVIYVSRGKRPVITIKVVLVRFDVSSQISNKAFPKFIYSFPNWGITISTVRSAALFEFHWVSVHHAHSLLDSLISRLVTND